VKRREGGDRGGRRAPKADCIGDWVVRTEEASDEHNY
jgi:hypothetical protein